MDPFQPQYRDDHDTHNTSAASHQLPTLCDDPFKARLQLLSKLKV